MKTIRFFGMALVAIALCFNLASCGDDDDELTPGSSVPKGVKAVDLGLPSGTKWANMNVGATSPEDYGDYFAWGETVPYGKVDKSNLTNYNYMDSYAKTDFDWSTYKWCNGSSTSMTKYCISSSYGIEDDKIKLDPTDDAAYVNWGKKWRMPTYDQIQELLDECTWTWTTMNGVRGYKVTSKAWGYEDNSIFLPAAGYRYDSSLDYAGSNGLYWSRTLYPGFKGYEFNSRYAFHLNSYSSGCGSTSTDRCSGLSVRPVLASE